MYRSHEIRTIHLEPTYRCNAACPQCPRTYQGGKLNDLLPENTELTLEDIKTITPVDFVKQLTHVYACGNYGDPAFTKEMHGIVQYYVENMDRPKFNIHTNGGLRPAEWWAELARILGPEGFVVFSIDGLEDTNHIYRRNVKWSTLMRNAEAFINAGGKARWEYLVFRHNEHQIKEAEEMAKNMGFQMFSPKKTGRFFDRKTGTFIEKTPVRNKDGEIESFIYRPNNEEWQNEALKEDLTTIIETYGSVNDYYNKTEVDCKVANNKAIYITADGYVFPCCWTASNSTYNQAYSQETKMMKELFHKCGGYDEVNGKIRPIQDIIEGTFFKEIEKSWSCASADDGKLITCSRICGVGFTPYKKQFTGRQ